MAFPPEPRRSGLNLSTDNTGGDLAVGGLGDQAALDLADEGGLDGRDVLAVEREGEGVLAAITLGRGEGFGCGSWSERRGGGGTGGGAGGFWGGEVGAGVGGGGGGGGGRAVVQAVVAASRPAMAAPPPRVVS